MVLPVVDGGGYGDSPTVCCLHERGAHSEHSVRLPSILGFKKA